MQAFLGWATVLNLGVLAVHTMVLVVMNDWVYDVTNSVFPISKEARSSGAFGYLANLRVVVTAFFLAPYVALRIVGGSTTEPA